MVAAGGFLIMSLAVRRYHAGRFRDEWVDFVEIADRRTTVSPNSSGLLVHLAELLLQLGDQPLQALARRIVGLRTRFRAFSIFFSSSTRSFLEGRAPFGSGESATELTVTDDRRGWGGDGTT